MKTAKKILAVLLSVLMAFSVMSVSASAEETTGEKEYYLDVDYPVVTKTKSDDPETVTEIQVGIYVTDEDDNSVDGALIAVNPDAKVEIIDYLIPMALAYGMEFSTAITEEKVFESVKDLVLATAKPVSYQDGVLTLSIYDRAGNLGAKLVGYNLLGQFEVPGMFMSNGMSKTVTVGGKALETYDDEFDIHQFMIEGVAYRDVKLPALVEKIAKILLNGGSYEDLIPVLLPLLPFALFVIPVVINSLVRCVQDFYSIYNVNVKKYTTLAKRAIYSAIPVLISMFF